MTKNNKRKHETFSQMILRRFMCHRIAMVSSAILILLVLASLSAGIISSNILGVTIHDIDLTHRYQQPSLTHLFGTDDLGRDVFVRLLYGGRVSLTVGLLSALTAAVIGTLIGAFAGYYGGWVDTLLMRFTDAMLSLPVLALMIILSAVDLDKAGRAIVSLSDTIYEFSSFIWLFGGWLFSITGSLISAASSGTYASMVKIILIVVFFSWMTVARLVRGEILSLKQREFIEAAKCMGATDMRIIFIHLIPNCMAPIIVSATLSVGGIILYESVLSFLGLGIQPPVPSWGNMLTNAQEYMYEAPYLAFFPGFFILLTVVSFNFLGDGLRDALDPRHITSQK